MIVLFFFTNGYCSNLEPRKSTIMLKHKGIKSIHYRFEFNTFTFRSFNWIHKMFYNRGKKYINKEIEEYLTPLALAIWIMDDCCCCCCEAAAAAGWANPGVRISTNSFTIEEVKFLVNILKEKFKLNCTIQYLKDIDR